MKNDWIIRAAKKADGSKNLVILENPDTKDYLDGLLINRFWPVIEKHLRGTNYHYYPEGKPKTDLDLSYTLERLIFQYQINVFFLHSCLLLPSRRFRGAWAKLSQELVTTIDCVFLKGFPA